MLSVDSVLVADATRSLVTHGPPKNCPVKNAPVGHPAQTIFIAEDD